MEYGELSRALRSHDGVEAGNPANSEDIQSIVSRLGELPDDYRVFLEEFNWASVGAHEIFGAGYGVPPYLDVVRMTESERDEANLDSGLIAIMNDGGGNLTCIDCRDGASGFRIVVWDHETSPQDGPSPEAPSFAVLVANLIGE